MFGCAARAARRFKPPSNFFPQGETTSVEATLVTAKRSLSISGYTWQRRGPLRE